MKGNYGKVRVEVEYHLLDGSICRKHKFLPPHAPSRWRGKIWFPGLKEGGFISQINEEPQGMFLIMKFDEDEKKFVLRQVDCDPIHWKGDSEGRGHGPNEICRKECPYYNDCPISVHLMITADID